MDKTVLYNLSYGMYAVGVKDEGNDKGCIANTVIQVTSENPMIMLSMNKNNYTYQVISRTKQFSVSVLSEQVDNNVIAELGYTSGKDKEKYKMFETEHTEEGLPIVKHEAVGYLVCDVLGMTDAETHMLITARVKDAFPGDGQVPMTYKYYREQRKGKAPKNAPTYQKETEGKGKRAVCTICGYVYEGSLADMPDDFICPVCYHDKSFFREE